MNTARRILLQIVKKVPDKDIPEVIDFINYLRLKKEIEAFADLESASESSFGFWVNDIDDEVWNDV